MLEAVHVPRPVWPFLLQEGGYNLPTGETTLFLLQQQIRHQGHTTEHTISGPNTLREGMSEHSGRNYDFEEGSETTHNPWHTLEQAMGHSSDIGTVSASAETAQTAVYQEDNEGYCHCETCQSYLHDGEYNEENDTDSESDVDDSMFTPEAINEYYGEDVDLNVLRDECLYAKRRYRRFSRKRT